MEVEGNAPGKRRDGKYEAEFLGEEAFICSQSCCLFQGQLAFSLYRHQKLLLYCSCLTNLNAVSHFYQQCRQVLVTAEHPEQTIVTHHKEKNIYIKHHSKDEAEKKKNSGHRELSDNA